jgi:chemotaxis protein methyltransferase CheR
MKNAPHHISDQQMSRLSDFVTAWLGLHFPRKRWRDLQRGLVNAARDLGLQSVDACVALLLSRQFTREQEQLLASHLTIGETYFFREQKSFDILESQVLPGLIAARRGRDQRLRIWSAGCSSGEEPYSLAILLSRLIPDPKEWQITILASDVNTRALAKAAQGLYGEWSFRGVPHWLRQKYFTKSRDHFYEISPAIRHMVSFAVLNLAEDSYPSLATNTSAMDIILCRNVLMYFEREKQLRVIDGFRRSLIDGGWLAVSPCETSAAFSAGFETVFFPDAVFYRKNVRGVKTAPGSLPPQPGQAQALPRPAFEQLAPPVVSGFAPQGPLRRPDADEILPLPPVAEPAIYEKALEFYSQGSYGEALDMLSRLALAAAADGGRQLHFERGAALMARCLANQGRIAAALEWADKAIAVDKLNPELYYLRATIFQEEGDISRAVASLKQALYLDQEYVLAHFALGTLTLQQGKKREADRYFENACSLLEARPSDEAVTGSDGMTVARLSEIIAATRAGIVQRIT